MEMKSLTLNGKTYDSFVDKDAREALESAGSMASKEILDHMRVLLNKALYGEDVSDLLAELDALLGNEPETPDVPDVPDVPDYSVLPSWIQEMQVVEFAPEVDTNAEQTFAISMENEPDMVFVLSDVETVSESRTFAAMFVLKNLSNIYAAVWYSSNTTSTISSIMDSKATTVSMDKSSVVLNTNMIGTENAYWRAGHNYKIYCLKTTADVSSLAAVPFADEMYAVEYEPEADTNEAVTFNYEMENEPNCVLILSDFTAKENVRDITGFFGNRLYNVDVWRQFTVMAGSTDFSNSVGDTTSGHITFENNAMTYVPKLYGSAAGSFRAGHKYMVIFMHI